MVPADVQLEIMASIARYNMAADLRDVEAMVQEFAPDGVITGDFKTDRGHEAMRRDLPAILEAEGTLKRHLAVNHRIEGAGDRLTVHYILVVAEAGAMPGVGATALITDTFVEIAGRWHVSQHDVRIDPGAKKMMEQHGVHG